MDDFMQGFFNLAHRLAQHQGQMLELHALKEYLRGVAGGVPPALAAYAKSRERELAGQFRLIAIYQKSLSASMELKEQKAAAIVADVLQG